MQGIRYISEVTNKEAQSGNPVLRFFLYYGLFVLGVNDNALTVRQQERQFATAELGDLRQIVSRPPLVGEFIAQALLTAHIQNLQQIGLLLVGFRKQGLDFL